MFKTNLNKFYVSSDKEQYFYYTVHGVTFKLRYAGKANKDFIATTAKQSLLIQNRLKDKSDEEKKIESINLSQEIDLNVLLESVLVGWEGLLDDNGKELSYNKSTAKELLTSLPDLLTELINEASKPQNFLLVDEKK